MERDMNNINDDICDNVETGKNLNELMTVDVDTTMKEDSNLPSGLEGRNNVVRKDYRRVLVPANRMKPLKDNWPTIVKALVEHMKIQVKMNTKLKCVEMRSCETTEDVSAIHKSEEFLKAFMCGFDLQDAIAMLRLEDLYLESFEVKDGDHLSRCIGRICGEKGKTKNAIENATRTRIIIQDQKISLLGSSTNINVARNSICSLILGAPPGKVYASLRTIGKKINDKL